MGTLPATPADVTPAWLNEHCDLGGTVSAVEATTIGEGVGLIAQLGRLRLTYSSGSGPETVIVKLPALVPELVQVAQMYGFYEREVSFYREAAHRLDNVGRAHHASMEDGGHPFVIVMEDLAQHRMIDQLEGCPAEEALLVADAAAALHARFWANDALDALTWLPPCNNPKYLGAQEQYGLVYDAFLARYGDGLSANGRRLADLLRTKTVDLMNHWAESGPLTMAHYDLRLDNLLFGDDRVYFIDWQLSAKQRGAFDLAYFLGWSMTDEVRRQVTPALIRRYHDALEANGVTGYPYQRCEDDVRQGLLGVALMGAYGSMAVPAANERGQAMLDAYVERVFAAADDLDALDTMV